VKNIQSLLAGKIGSSLWLILVSRKKYFKSFGWRMIVLLADFVFSQKYFKSFGGKKV